MDLFIVNRYKGPEDDTDLINQETIHLQKLKQKIEERKKAYKAPKTSDVITLKPDQTPKPLKNKDDTTNIEPMELEETNTEKIDNNVDQTPISLKQKPSLEFKVLGCKDFDKKTKVERVLPYWLSHPFSVSKNLQTLTCKVEEQTWLSSILKTTLASENVTHLFPVQEQVIPFILKEHQFSNSFWPNDVCVSAPTGSGKTLSFVLPIIQVLMKEIGHHIRALIVLPVQELAMQVAKVFKKYCTNTGLKVALLSGSTPLHKEQQQIMRYTETMGWISEMDIIVCTAGRLVEHLQNTEGFSLKYLKFLVIDEADRIMDNIQNDWLYHLDKHIKQDNQSATNKIPHLNWNNITSQKPPPHKLLFSATLSPDPELLEQWGLFQPKLFSVAPINDLTNDKYIKKYATPDELQENICVCNEAEEKPLILFHLLAEKLWNKVLCFTNSAQSAHRLTVLLNTWSKGSLKVAELSAALERSKREVVLKNFKESEINVIISTDALARGIDIPNCNYVVSYDPPRNIKTYIHRVGRTGRAGHTGHAVTILMQNQVQMFKEIMQSGEKSDLPQLEIPTDLLNRLSNDYRYAIKETKDVIHTELNDKVKKSIVLKRGSKSKPPKRKRTKSK
ncbi:probable ATP-dependent RNA helicase Dbp73D [Epargyreus clarus]|uniref:probable ATP-dependent RNA helicase Dbp73D n=1 Tax=Epargyreus clarus TaxID=520877 RepID=UPI003C2DB7AF